MRYKDYYVAYDKRRKTHKWVIFKDNPNGIADACAIFTKRHNAIIWLMAQDIKCRIFFKTPNSSDGVAGIIEKKENANKYSVNFIINHTPQEANTFIDSICLNEDKTINIKKQQKALKGDLEMKIEQDLSNYDLKILDKNFDGNVKKDTQIRIIDGVQLYYNELQSEFENFRTNSTFVSDDVIFNTTPTKDDEVDPTNMHDIEQILQMKRISDIRAKRNAKIILILSIVLGITVAVIAITLIALKAQGKI
ncbi:Uncharacterised protein [Mycoplasmopsis californica]|uniref:Uncharacterized protein n=1 Tax=Mycoplasmopsis equigenitalium TaxID=114883 RepID=A0ABY5J1M0_9BACT|nr:hypothetical protein [Mycoplasmopsis equigenitalium]UUD37152.1 hypothetical protein NPA09_01085 [Mycoplasmopsis equigenitalium]VEU69542.1 Uncharacterised protein [Mycoplasmopsis californica]